MLVAGESGMLDASGDRMNATEAAAPGRAMALANVALPDEGARLPKLDEDGSSDVTRLLHDAQAGDEQATEALLPLV